MRVNFSAMEQLSDDLTLFVLKEKDAMELAALEAACFSTAWSAEQYAKLLRAVEAAGAAFERRRTLPPFYVLGIGSNDGLAAYISLGLHQAAEELEIYNIAVDMSQRQRGLGKSLLEYALRTAAGFGLSRAVLEVRVSNTPALALYAATGFVECGRRKGYYADTGEDALVLARNLP